MPETPAEHGKDARDRAPGNPVPDPIPEPLLDSTLGHPEDGAADGDAAEDAERLGMAAGRFRPAKAFIRGSMDRDEQLDYLLHVQRCPDCRGYLDAALMIARRRERIRERLEKGGRH